MSVVLHLPRNVVGLKGKGRVVRSRRRWIAVAALRPNLPLRVKVSTIAEVRPRIVLLERDG